MRRLREERNDSQREVDRLRHEGERDRDEVHRLLGDNDSLRGRLRDVEAQVGLCMRTCVLVRHRDLVMCIVLMFTHRHSEIRNQ